MDPIGCSDPTDPVILNVLGDNIRNGYYVVDHNYRDNCPCDYYKENDLMIGAQMDVFGRKVVITDLDEFTKDHYRYIFM